MRKLPLAAALTGLALAFTTPAHAISGGEEANSDYIVQIGTQTESGKIDHCTGSALNSEWILTAAHCVEDGVGPTSSNVYFSNSKAEPGEPIAAADTIQSPDADLALIKLAQPRELASYATLGAGHEFTPGEHGFIYGYGRGIAGETMPWLRRAEVKQVDEGRDAYWNSLYRLEGIDGTSNNGDSGGPFFVDNKLVGINVVGAHVANDFWIGEESGALELRPFVSWIEKMTGVQAVPFGPGHAGASPAPGADDDPAASATEPAVQEPAVEPSEDPADEPAAEPSEDPADEPAAEPSEDPADEPAAEPSTDSASEPDEVPGADPAGEPSAQPAAEPNFEPSIEPSAEPSVVPSGDPAGETGVEPSERHASEAGQALSDETASGPFPKPTTMGAPGSAVSSTSEMVGPAPSAPVSARGSSRLAYSGSAAVPLFVIAICAPAVGAFLLRRFSSARAHR